MSLTVPLFVIMKEKKVEHTKVNNTHILTEAKRVLQQEIYALEELHNSINDDFTQLINIANTTIDNKNKIIIIGLGKSGLIAKKIVATLKLS